MAHIDLKKKHSKTPDIEIYNLILGIIYIPVDKITSIAT